MKKNRKQQRKKVNFCEVRYPKRTKTASTALSDEDFWKVYYGTCFGGIMAQTKYQFRWHALQCLEDGFRWDDEKLLLSRRILIGMLDACESFFFWHKEVIESAAFKEREASVDAMSIEEQAGSMCEWMARSYRANIEHEWYLRNPFLDPHLQTGMSLFYMGNRDQWYRLLLEDVDHNRWCPVYWDWLRGLGADDVLALITACVKSELDEMTTLTNANDADWRTECLIEFMLFLVRRRDKYVKSKPQVAALDEQYGHTNFGLDFEVCVLTEERYLKIANSRGLRLDAYHRRKDKLLAYEQSIRDKSAIR